MRLGLTLSSLHMITKSADDNTVHDNQEYSERHDNQEPQGMITKSLSLGGIAEKMRSFAGAWVPPGWDFAWKVMPGGAAAKKWAQTIENRANPKPQTPLFKRFVDFADFQLFS